MLVRGFRLHAGPGLWSSFTTHLIKSPDRSMRPPSILHLERLSAYCGVSQVCTEELPDSVGTSVPQKRLSHKALLVDAAGTLIEPSEPVTQVLT